MWGPSDFGATFTESMKFDSLLFFRFFLFIIIEEIFCFYLSIILEI